MLWVQDSPHTKSNTPCPIVHFSVVISRKLIVIVVGASLLFLIANSQAEPHSTKALTPDHQKGFGTDTHFPKTAYQWDVEQELTSPRSVVKFEVPIRRIEDGERRNFIENCSAYAVQKTSEHYLFLSSWHCIDGYQRFRKSLVVKHAGRSAQPTFGESGGNMKQDWLLMTAPLLAFDNSLAPTPLSSQPVETGEILYGFGWGGHAQSPQSSPKVLRCQAMEVGRMLTLDCGFSKGDSGGLIARRTNSGYEAVGIISAGDSSTVTYAYPVSALPASVSSQLMTMID